ncbi:MAG: DUF4864 domain-containing protein [Hyphomicrobiales bacterium]|nr:DUF4864 domain-containing protein [Hyphomicrobiales bacterium]
MQERHAPGIHRGVARALSRFSGRALAAMLILVPAGGFAFTDDDRAESRAVIEHQIDAFRRDDAAAAFAFASPELQILFHDPDHFMAMVRNGYGPVYRPRSYNFSGAVETPEGLTDTLLIEDAEGQAWTAIYTLEKQPDGSWKITSCHLVRASVST